MIIQINNCSGEQAATARRVLLASLRTQESKLNIRIRVITAHAKRDTLPNLQKDLDTTRQLIATLQ